MTKLEGKLLEIIERQSLVIDKQQQQIENLRGDIVALRRQLVEALKHPHPEDKLPAHPGYQYDSDKIPMNPCGPSDWPPAPPIMCGDSITVTPDPDHLPYGYDPKDPLNSRHVSLNTTGSRTYKEWRTE